MHNIESEFHSLLEEIAPNAHSTDEQARIIAEASAIFNRIASRRTAKVNNSRLKEAQMTESILQAMKSISEYENSYAPAYIDAKGLSNLQIVRQASKSSIETWGTNKVLNPTLLDELEDTDAELFDFENGDNQEPDAFTEKPKSRNDFQSSPNR
jgi:hypothetical protein